MFCKQDERSDNNLLSVRHILLGSGQLFYRLHKCLLEAKKFLSTTTLSDLVDSLFSKEENRRCVLECAQEKYHVGFMVGSDEKTIETLTSAANAAGFNLDHATFASTIVARELGVLCGKPMVPTTIFKAGMQAPNGSCGYIEAFVPEERKDVVDGWIQDEVVDHVGLTLRDATDFHRVSEAFQSEGFKVPSFLNEAQMTNPSQNVTVIYFDKVHRNRKLRVEVLCK